MKWQTSSSVCFLALNLFTSSSVSYPRAIPTAISSLSGIFGSSGNSFSFFTCSISSSIGKAGFYCSIGNEVGLL